jgi:hypothetical protein
MARARAKLEWGQTAHVLCMLYNAHRDPKRSEALSPNDLNPFAEPRPAIGISTSDFSFMRAFCTEAVGS